MQHSVQGQTTIIEIHSIEILIFNKSHTHTQTHKHTHTE